jgi:hypothetical protein
MYVIAIAVHTHGTHQTQDCHIIILYDIFIYTMYSTADVKNVKCFRRMLLNLILSRVTYTIKTKLDTVFLFYRCVPS